MVGQAMVCTMTLRTKATPEQLCVLMRRSSAVDRVVHLGSHADTKQLSRNVSSRDCCIATVQDNVCRNRGRWEVGPSDRRTRRI